MYILTYVLSLYYVHNYDTVQLQESPDSPKQSPNGVISTAAPYEQPISAPYYELVDPASSPTPEEITTSAYAEPYASVANIRQVYRQPSCDERKIYEQFEGKRFRKLHHNDIRFATYLTYLVLPIRSHSFDSSHPCTVAMQ